MNETIIILDLNKTTPTISKALYEALKSTIEDACDEEEYIYLTQVLASLRDAAIDGVGAERLRENMH